MEAAVLEFWRSYLDGLPPDLDQEQKLSGVFSFGDSKKLVDELAVLPFREVSKQFAFEEGEGDRSLAYWRMAHENYFRRNHFENRALDETMLVVCERFKVVHTKQ